MQNTRFIQSWLKGYGQIMLQNSSLTGLMFLVGIGLNSVPMLLGCILGGLIATLIGTQFRTHQNLHDGLYGFNGALVGIAGAFFLQPSAISLCLITFGIILTTLCTRALQRLALPGFTAPFVVTIWAMLAAAPLLGIPAVEFPELHVDLPLLSSTAIGLGQVMFQGDTLAGLCFLLGLAFNDWRSAGLALLGSALGCLAILIPGVSDSLVINGLYSYNPALTTLALGLTASRYAIIRLLLGISITTVLTHLFILQGLPALTTPFVLATWSVLSVEKRLRDRSIKDC